MAIRRRRIKSLIQGLLVSHKIKEAPVPVEKIAKARGARIFYQSLDNDMSGFLYRDKAQAVIGVNTHHAPVRQNFTTPMNWDICSCTIRSNSMLIMGSVVVIARKLTYGNSVAIPAIAKTKNMRRYREDSWLGDLDSNRD